MTEPSSTLAADRNAATGAPTGSSSSPMTAAYSTGPEATQSLRILAPSYAPQTVAREQEVNLFDLVERGPGAKLTPASVEIKDREKFFTAGVVDVGGETYKVPVDVAMRDAIVMGLAVTTYAERFDGGGAIPLKLSLPFEPIKLTAARLTQVLAGNALDSDGTSTPRPCIISSNCR